MPPKKKIAGDATKGEKTFKNMCAVCHSFAVTISTISFCLGSWNRTKSCRDCWITARSERRIQYS